MRPGFDEWALDMAAAVAKRSRDPSTKVGAVIIRPDKSVASVGYNGFPRGMEDREEWYTDRDEKYDRVVHAEMNALLSSKENVAGMTMYVTAPCCKDCAKHIAAAGIKRVVWAQPNEAFLQRWRKGLERAIEVLAHSGVEMPVTLLSLPPEQAAKVEEDAKVATARRLASSINQYSSLYITVHGKGKYCLETRTFAAVEVEWDFHCWLTLEQAREIVSKGYAAWWTLVKEEDR